MLKWKNIRWDFSPLYYDDGRPCYFRASCLALCAFCMLLSVALKDDSSSADDAQDLMAQNQGTEGVMHLTPSSGVTVSSEGVILGSISDSSNLQMTHRVPLQHGEAASSMVNAAAATSMVENDPNATSGVLTADMIAQSNAAAEAQDNEQILGDEDEGWSFLGLFDSDHKEKKALMANRKQALDELVNGAAFLQSCGDINAGYLQCHFNFSEQVSSNYDSSIEAATDGFRITLLAKGEQLQDGCAKFVVDSAGVYQAFDANGNAQEKCLLGSVIKQQQESLHNAVAQVSSNASPSVTSLAQSR